MIPTARRIASRSHRIPNNSNSRPIANLQRPERDDSQERSQRRDDGDADDDFGRGSDQGRSPAAHGPERQRDGQRLDELDQGAEEGGDDRRSGVEDTAHSAVAHAEAIGAALGWRSGRTILRQVGSVRSFRDDKGRSSSPERAMKKPALSAGCTRLPPRGATLAGVIGLFGGYRGTPSPSPSRMAKELRSVNDNLVDEAPIGVVTPPAARTLPAADRSRASDNGRGGPACCRRARRKPLTTAAAG